jgi:hypothetical protein
VDPVTRKGLTAQWELDPKARGVGKGKAKHLPMEAYDKLVTRDDRDLARRLLHETAMRDTLHDNGLDSLIRACRGRAWMGDPERWAFTLARVAVYYVEACEQAGVEPTTYTLFRQRKEWTRAWAQSVGANERLTPTLYETPTPTDPEEMPRAYFDHGPEADRDRRDG